MTTVHSSQVVEGLRREVTDLPLHWIVTPEEAFQVTPPPAPSGAIDWARLSPEDLEEMPVLKELRGAS